MKTEMINNENLTEDQIELINRIYKKVLSIGKMKMDTISYQLYINDEKEVYLPKGTLIHFTKYNEDIVKEISKEGIIAGEVRDKKNTTGLNYVSSFYKMNIDTILNTYNNKEFSIKDNIGFIINPTSKLGGILYYNILDDKFDNNIMVRDIISPSKRIKDDNLAYILVGIPSNSISGIIVGDSLLSNNEIINNLKHLFPNSYLITKEGYIIKDRSNIIKIEDYEIMSLEYAKVRIENNLLKKEIKNILNTVKNNTTFYEQAKIYKKLGYKIPKGLLKKLSDEEINSL